MIPVKQQTIDSYIMSFPEGVGRIMEKIRRLVLLVAPEALETIGYGIPTFKIGGRNFVHFAGYKKHIGLYPTPSVIEAFQEELTPYKTSKGAIQFPIDAPIPYDLIQRIVLYRHNQMV